MKNFIFIIISICFFSVLCLAQNNIVSKNNTIEQEISKLKERIIQEKDNVKKITLENQIKVKNLELEATKIAINSNINNLSIQEVTDEATSIKKGISALLSKFENLLDETTKEIADIYDKQIETYNNNKEKGEWETTEEFNKRLNENKQKQKELELKKEQELFNNEISILKSMIKAIEPFSKRLSYFQTEKFYDKDEGNIVISSFGNINADDKYFMINIVYQDREYSLKYDFSDIGREKAKIIYDTPNNFKVKALFSLDSLTQQTITAFKVSCLDIKDKIIVLPTQIKKFTEVEEFELFKEKFESFNKANDKLLNTTKEFKNNKKLKKFTKIIDYLEDVYNISNYIKLKNYKNYRKFVDELDEELDDLIISISCSKNSYFIAGLKKDGTVVTVGDCYDFDKNNIDIVSQKWTDIVDVSVSGGIIAGLKKNGTVVAVGCNHTTEKKYGNKGGITKWKNISQISVGAGGFIIGLKKDGTPITAIWNRSDKSIQNWNNLSYVSGDTDFVIGLRKDGTVAISESNRNYNANWNNIMQVSQSSQNLSVFGLKKNGTVVAVKITRNNGLVPSYEFNDIYSWKNIVQVSAGGQHVVGLKKDGRVVATGNNFGGQCDVDDWTDIISISTGYFYTAGIKSDGSIVVVGKNTDNIFDAEDWDIDLPEFKFE